MSDRAPDNMPTETIQRFIETQEQAFSEAQQEEAAALRKLKRAIHAQHKADTNLNEYRHWLWRRNGEARK